MDFLRDKLNSLAGNTLSEAREFAEKRNQQESPDEAQAVAKSASTHLLGGPSPAAHLPVPGSPFGGDCSLIRAPPIGFRTEYLVGPSLSGPQPIQHQLRQPELPDRQDAASERSLYEGNTWMRVWFQRVMLLTLVRLLLFIRKIYEDFLATKLYGATGHTGHFIVSAAALFLPTVVFTIYRLSRYLQIALPTTRADHQPASGSPKLDDEARLKKALMGGAGGSSQASQQDEDGLVTARQTPSQLDDSFHDSRSQQASSPAPSTAIVKDSPRQAKHDKRQQDYKESVEIDKLGYIPDKETVRVAIGASEQILHGSLFVFWQLKRQVDVIGYLVERSCLWRKPREHERDEIERLRVGSDGLEWFQDFYAAFLAILIQVYTLGLHWTSGKGDTQPTLKASTLHESTASLGAPLAKDSELSTNSVLSSMLSQYTLLNEGRDLMIMSELLVSCAVVSSLLVAVRRRDDGPLTLGLSMLGWGSIFAARIIIIALAFVHLSWRIMVPALFGHVLGITAWIYKIAIDSHNGKISESEEFKWEEPSLTEEGRHKLEPDSPAGKDSQPEQPEEPTVTSQWSTLERITLLTQIVNLFAIPSIFYWPIMFNLKLHYRPYKYLVLILSENFILIPTIWFSISTNATLGQWYLLGAVGAFSIIGFIFVSLYICCKPSLTEYFARADELFNEAEQSGIYYEFCSRVFRMPDLSKRSFRRLMNQTEQMEEIELE